jgi:hypothetical protein
MAGRAPESFRWDIFLLGLALGVVVFYRAAWKAFRLWDRANPLPGPPPGGPPGGVAGPRP